MRTRSSTPTSPFLVSPTITTQQYRRRNRRRAAPIVEPEIRTIPDPPVEMAEERTMLELLQAPTEGYGEAIVVPAIVADFFELKPALLNLLTSNQFYRFERDDPQSHMVQQNHINHQV